MKNIIFIVVFLLCGWKGFAQIQSKNIALDSLHYSLEKLISNHQLAYSYLGEVYIIVLDIKNEKIETAFLLSIKDPKVGPNNNILYYDLALEKVFQGIYRITQLKNQNIVLPLITNIQRTISVS